MKKFLSIALACCTTLAAAQTAGDVATFKKATGVGDTKTYTTPVNSSLFSLNSSGNFALLAQSNFITTANFNGLGDARWDPLTHERAQHDGLSLTFHEFGVYDVLEGRAERATGADLLTWIQQDGEGLWSPLAHTHTFASLTSKPTTIAGYGITDFNSLGDARWSLLGHTHAASDITSGVLATARLGTGTANSTTYLRGDGTWQTVSSGVTDHGALSGLSDDDHPQYHNDARGDARYSLLAHTHTFASLTSKPTTIAGYGITDFNSLGDARWSLLGHTHAASDVTSGVFNHARLGTGGGGSTKFLREDGTWQTVSSGGGTWGSITGTLSDQTDLSSYLETLANGIGAVLPDQTGNNGKFLTTDGSVPAWQTLNSTAVGLGNVENTALSTWAGSTNITTLGTVGTGTWSATPIAIANGGTGSGDGPSARTALGLKIGVDVQAYDAALDAVSGTNTGDQTSIVGITGTLSEFNTALTGADFATGGGTATGTNTGDQSESSIEAVVDLQDLQGAVTDAQVPNNITITNLSGTNTGDQTITLTGDVTGSGTGSFATTVAETELAALASTTSAANKVPYYTGSGTASTTDLKMGTEAAYSGTVTWTAGAAPSGANNIRQYYVQIGNMVTWTICLTYATAGTTVTNVSLTFPSEFPTPDIPTGFTGADVRIWNCTMTRMLPTPTTAGFTAVSSFFVSRNGANNGFVIGPTAAFASSTVRQITFAGIYFTQ